MSGSDVIGGDPEDVFPRTWGPFTLLGSLGRGGMGEVFLAERGGFAGIAKRCVVKTLRAGFSDDREYVTRFRDEARIVIQLQHPNICPVFDFGLVGAQHYLAMEYIPGRDMRTVQVRAAAAGRPLDTGLALHVVSSVLEALDYAHRFVDPVTGAPLMLVHRDISPHNVMVGFEGDVRLIDFGLAASTLKIEQTAPNVVMGKVAYMAPEQIYGEHLDSRADQFAGAMMAYELYSGERFYEDRSPRETYQLAAQGGFRPAKFAALPDDLRAALDRGLAAQRDARFDTCAELREAVEAFRYKSGLRGDARALRGLMQQVFAIELQAERQVLGRSGSSSVPVAVPAADGLVRPPATWEGQRSDPSMNKVTLPPVEMTSSSGVGLPPPIGATVSNASPAEDSAVQTAPVRKPTSGFEESAPTTASQRHTALQRAEADERAVEEGLRAPRRRRALIAAGIAVAVAALAAAFVAWTATHPAPPDGLVLGVAPVAHDTAPVAHDTAHDTAPVAHDAAPVAHDTAPVAHDAAPVAHDAAPVAHDADGPRRARGHVKRLHKKVPGEELTSARLSWLADECPTLACAAPLMKRQGDWAKTFPPGAPLVGFKLEVRRCVEQCKDL